MNGDWRDASSMKQKKIDQCSVNDMKNGVGGMLSKRECNSRIEIILLRTGKYSKNFMLMRKSAKKRLKTS